MSIFKCEKNNYKYKFGIILLLAILLRFWQLGIIPGGGAINQDEAYAGYEAYSLLNYGIDTDGYSNPVYFTAWGSGMNVMESYLMIPFISILGLTPLAIRLPMAVISISTIISFGMLLKEQLGEKESLIGMTLLSIMPWHVMLSRWGLESNLFPGFCLLALFFLCKATRNDKYIIVSLGLYGLTLYTYASPWVIMPFLIGFSLMYLLIIRKIQLCRNFILGIALLVLISCPLILFVLVNYGFCPELVTQYVSIPKLVYFRSGDINFNVNNIIQNLIALFRILLTQDDGLIWNSIPSIGIFYRISFLFIVVGIIYCFYNSISKFRTSELDTLINIQFIFSLILGMLINVNVNRINIIMLPIIYYCCRGIVLITDLFVKKKLFFVNYVVITAYITSFIFFISYYFTSYNDLMANYWGKGIDEALQYTDEIQSKKIHILDVHYPVVLFFTKYPTEDYLSTVEWDNPNIPFRTINSFGKYSFYDFTGMKPIEDDAYICRLDDKKGVDYMKEHDMKMATFDYYIVGYFE